MSTARTANTERIDRALNIAAVFFVTLFMFLPLFAVSLYISSPTESISDGAAEATVGIGVILRAIARRLFRAGARNIIRVTFGTMTRAVARTATTRIIRVFLRSTAGSLAKELGDEGEAESLDHVAGSFWGSSLLAVLIGLAATATSFWGVLLFAEPLTIQALNTEMNLSLSTLLFAAAIPLACFAVIAAFAGSLFAATPMFTTGIDGLFIQAYFTLSGSFLPMTTDFEFRGKRQQCCKAAVFSLSLMLAIFALLRWIGIQADNQFAIFLSAMFLTYAFVYTFPVHPLMGHSIWVQSKCIWLLIFLPMLATFLFAFPSVVASLL